MTEEERKKTALDSIITVSLAAASLFDDRKNAVRKLYGRS